MWRNMTPQMLEKQYSPSQWSHRYDADTVVKLHVEALTKGSLHAKSVASCEPGLAYGVSECEVLDIFSSSDLPDGAPIFVYIHGGYWQMLSRGVSSFMVPPLIEAGAAVVVVGYSLAPEANMDEIVKQLKSAIRFILHMAKRRAASGVYLCGHSAGAHLAAMMLTVNWMEEFMISPSLIKGALLVSGIYDVQPLISTYVNGPLKMTEEDAMKNSPANYVQQIAKHFKNMRELIVAVGQHDSPEFRRQSHEFYENLRREGMNVRYVDVVDTDHFSLIESLHESDSPLTHEAQKMMNLVLT